MPKTLMVDSSVLIYSGCVRKLYLTVAEGRKSIINANDTEWGTAFHKFRAHIREHGVNEMMEAIALAVNHYRTCKMYIKKEHLTENYLKAACAMYAQTYMMSDSDNLKPVLSPHDNRPLLECKFAIPYYLDDDWCILLVGTMDEIGKIKGGCYTVADCKTSGAWDKESHSDSFIISNQFLFYMMILRLYSKMAPDSIYGEIMRSGPVGVMIDGVYTDNKQLPEFRRGAVEFIPEWTLNEYEVMAKRKIDNFIDFLKHDLPKDEPAYLPPREGILTGACWRYKQCDLYKVCSAPDIVAQRMILDNLFPMSVYNPLLFQT